MVGSFCLGVIDGILEDALEYMKQRHAFVKPIGQFQALQHYVADIATMQTTTELLVNYAAWKMTTGQDCGLESNMVKLVASENANKRSEEHTSELKSLMRISYAV